MANGTAARMTSPLIFATRAVHLDSGSSSGLLMKACVSSSQSAPMASGKRTRAYPDQSRKSLPLDCPESHEMAPATSAPDHSQSTGRHQFDRAPLSAP